MGSFDRIPLVIGSFVLGNTVDISQGIHLSDLPANFQQLSDTGQIFKGHCKFRRVYNARAQVQLRDSVLRHVSPHGLTSDIPKQMQAFFAHIGSPPKHVISDFDLKLIGGKA